MKTDDLLNDLNNFSTPKPPALNAEKTFNIIRAKDCKEVMVNSFRNGKKRGETTHFKLIDPTFTWKKTFVNVWTGHPNMGKSEILRQLSLAKAIGSNWKVISFVPEDMSSEGGKVTADEYFDSLIHAYVGKSTDPFFKNNQMTEGEYLDAIDFMSKHFIVIDPPELTVQDALDHFQYVINNEPVDMIVLDPWNKLIHEYSREDTYLAKQFAIIKRFATKNNVSFNIVAHPKTTSKLADGSIPVADQFSLSGGSMWNNAMDGILAVHRPQYHIDKSDVNIDFHSHKLRNQKLIGLPGISHLTFDRKTNRYLENGVSPIAVLKNEIISRAQTSFNSFPTGLSGASSFDAPSEPYIDPVDPPF